MPSQVVVVLRDEVLAKETAERLNQEGYRSLVLTNSIIALDAMQAAREVELLITSVDFPEGQMHGLALARMTRRRRPNLVVIFVDDADLRSHVEKEGAFIPTPPTPESIVAMVGGFLRKT
jgi:DNA-binding NtrC family response regulator